MNKLTAYGKVKDGVLSLHSRRRFAEDVRQIRDCEVIITIKKRGRVSDKQRGYLFGCVYKELQIRFTELGHRLDIDDIHEWAKGKFNPERIIDADGVVIAEFPGSTQEFNKDMMTEYIELIRHYAAEVLEIQIPDPDSSLSLL